jgi:hypothetical protein
VGVSKANGHVKRRRGILGHLQDGRITLLEEGAHDVIGMLADKATGIWFGSARAFAASCGAGDVSERQARHLLESLGRKGYIRRFSTPRAHGNYPILVNKYEVTFGAQKGMRLNAERTTDWRNPVYEPCLEHGAERAPYQEVEVERELKPSSPQAVPSGDGVALAALLKQRILENNPSARIMKAQEANWAREADRMLRIDRRTVEQIRELVEWSQRDSFWRTNIFSMGKLREKFDQLAVKKNQSSARREPSRAERVDEIPLVKIPK